MALPAQRVSTIGHVEGIVGPAAPREIDLFAVDRIRNAPRFLEVIEQKEREGWNCPNLPYLRAVGRAATQLLKLADTVLPALTTNPADRQATKQLRACGMALSHLHRARSTYGPLLQLAERFSNSLPRDARSALEKAKRKGPKAKQKAAEWLARRLDTIRGKVVEGLNTRIVIQHTIPPQQPMPADESEDDDDDGSDSDSEADEDGDDGSNSDSEAAEDGDDSDAEEDGDDSDAEEDGDDSDAEEDSDHSMGKERADHTKGKEHADADHTKGKEHADADHTKGKERADHTKGKEHAGADHTKGKERADHTKGKEHTDADHTKGKRASGAEDGEEDDGYAEDDVEDGYAEDGEDASASASEDEKADGNKSD